MMTTAGNSPWGKTPPFSDTRWRPGAIPSTPWPVTTSSVPTTRNSISAPTLTSENQNSISPNHFTATMFMPPTKNSATRAKSHCGTSAKVSQ